MKIQMIRGYKLQQNVWKYKSVILICGLQMIFYHKTYYNRFVYYYRKIPKENPLLNEEVPSQSAEKEFLILIKRKTDPEKLLFFIWPKCWTKTCMKCIAPMKTSGTAKRWNTFSKKTLKSLYASRGTWNSWEPIVVHAHEVNPVDYVISSIIGAGLPDEEITISFAKIIHRKIKPQETRTSFPLSAENLFEELDKSDSVFCDF